MRPKMMVYAGLGLCMLFLGVVLCRPSYGQVDPYLQLKSMQITPDGQVKLVLENDTIVGSVNYEVYCTEETYSKKPHLSKTAYWRLVKRGTCQTSSPYTVFTDNGSKIRKKPTNTSVVSRFYVVAAASYDNNGDQIPDIINDYDNDGLSDAYELLVTKTSPLIPDNDGDYVVDSLEDFDEDGLLNKDEYLMLTDPWIPDTDNDGLTDAVETGTGIFESAMSRGTNPLNPDTDEDGLSDNEENLIKVFDGFESGDFSILDWNQEGDYSWGVVSDIKKDGVYSARTSATLVDDEHSVLLLSFTITDSNLFTFDYKLSTQQDSDFFLIKINNQIVEAHSGEKGWIKFIRFLPAGTYDIRFIYSKDGEGSSGSDAVWIDNISLISGTDPNQGDADGDRLSDRLELLYGTCPFLVDSDNDSISDLDEIARYGSNPGMVDSDMDGLDDYMEINLGTDPVSGDTDKDSIPDGWEVSMGLMASTPDSMYDNDSDGLTNYEEYFLGTDPLDSSKPKKVYVDNEGSGGTGTQADPYGSIQEALDVTVYNTGGNSPAIFILADGIYDLSKDTYMSGLNINYLWFDNEYLNGESGYSYRAALFTPNPGKVEIVAKAGHPVVTFYKSKSYSNSPNILKNLIIRGGTIGLDIQLSAPLVVNCKITENVGLAGCGIKIDQSSPQIVNCLITKNKSLEGAGIYMMRYSTPEIAHTTITGNVAQKGVGIYSNGYNNAKIFNSIIWEPSGDDLYNVSSASIKYSNIEDGDYKGQNNNISQNPLFANPKFGNFHLKSGSPCRDVASPFGLFTPDLDNEFRPITFNPSDDDQCDMGFDEFVDSNSNDLPDYWENKYTGPFTAAGDDDSDGVTNAVESAHETNPNLADTDSDGLNDYLEIVTHGTNPNLNDDYDGDTLLDSAEVLTHNTSPTKKDTDGDLLPDDWEIANTLDPNVNDADLDPDTDSFTNYEEFFLYTNPKDIDDPYLYPASDYSSIQEAMTGTGGATPSIQEDRVSYGFFVAAISLDTGDYVENITMLNNVAIIANSPFTTKIKGSNANNLVQLDNDGNCLFKNINFSDGGRAFYIRKTNVYLSNCIVSKNSREGVSWDGGAVYAYDSYMEIFNTTFNENTSHSNGGAIFADLSSVYITNSDFTENSAYISGGAIYIKNSVLEISGGLFETNKTKYATGVADDSGNGGCIYISNTSPFSGEMKIKNALIRNNEAFSAGAGIFVKNVTLELDNDTVLDNITKYRRDNDLDGFGGGLYAFSSLVTIADSTFNGNKCFVAGAGAYAKNYFLNLDNTLFDNNISEKNGGALSLFTVGLDSKNSTFSNNQALAESAGGLQLDGGFAVLDNCLINNNSSMLDGAGIHALSNQFILTDTKITGNEIIDENGSGAGLLCEANTSSSIISSEIKNNISPKSGGGAYLKNTNVSFENSLISDNVVGLFGGGLYLYNSQSSITDSIIKNNTSVSGGGIFLYSVYDSGAGYPPNPSLLNMKNSIVKSNTAQVGGGIYVDEYARAIITYSAIVENISSTPDTGGILWNNEDPSYTAQLKNTILWNNTGDLDGFDETKLIYCTIEDGDFEGLNGNISIPPNFINPTNDDYHIRSDSGLINMGSAYYSEGSDVDGETRPVTTNYFADKPYHELYTPRPIDDASDIGIDEFNDTDEDGLPDYWEERYAGTLENDGDGDFDGVINSVEYYYDSNPYLVDTDNDGVSDYDEIYVHHTNPVIDGDEDQDGILDKDEINGTFGYTTDPLSSDTDSDRMPDKWEIDNGYDPTDPEDSYGDSDNDSITNYEEFYLVTDPNNDSVPVHVQASLFSSIQSAIDNSTAPAVIVLANNSYLENIVLKDGISIYGFKDPQTGEISVIKGNEKDPVISVSNLSQRSIIKNISLKNGGYGIFCSYSEIAVLNCKINDNNNSGIYVQSCSKDVLIANNKIFNNTASFGGGLYLNNSSLEIVNCDIYGNNANEGGGIYIGESGSKKTSPIIANSNIVNNTATICGGILLKKSSLGLKVYNTNIFGNGDDLSGVELPMVYNSNIEDGDFFGENGNISQAPQFGAPQFGRFNLLYNSPCVNSGYDIKYFPIDVDSEDRKSGSAVDIGSDEFIDLDNDNLADIWESFYIGNFAPSNDNDNDGLSNLIEYQYFTDPYNEDTDNDSLTDLEEVNGFLFEGNTIYTDPFVRDMDGDGLTDGEESAYSTNPINSDTDNDGMDDLWEVNNSLNPTEDNAGKDYDNDGLFDIDEYKLGTAPDNDADPQTVYVDHAGSGDYTSLSLALYGVSPPAKIIVKEGTYTETVMLKDKVAIIGESKEGVIFRSTGSDPVFIVKNIDYAIIKDITISDSFRGVYSQNAILKLENCIIKNNVKKSEFGAGLCFESSYPEIVNCLITGNSSTASAGGIYFYASTASIVDTVISENIVSSVSGTGGGIICRENSNIFITGSKIENNTVGGKGAGIYAIDSYVKLEYSSIINNASASSFGGGFYSVNATIDIFNCYIAKNSSKFSGGGVYLKNSTSNISYSVIVNNQASNYEGGGIYLDSTVYAQIKNSILWNNTDDLYGVDVSMLSFCNIEDADFMGTNGNISADPMLVNIDIDNFHVMSNSPCVNTGSTDTNNPDIDGEARPDASINDMGADEVVDVDNDGLADYWELIYFATIAVIDNNGDYDSDLLSNLNEYIYGTDPKKSDTDNDGLTDIDEINNHGTDPVDPDTDDDGLNDGDEILTHSTDPKNKDTDGDFIDDNYEVNNSLDPLDPSDANDDPDNDSLTNMEEYYIGSGAQSDTSPSTLNVTSSQNIQTVIDSASTPVKIVLAPGTYRNLDPEAKSIALKDGVVLYTDESNPAILTTDGNDSVLTMNALSGILLKNIVIKNGTIGIYSQASNCLINNCRIEGNLNTTEDGGGIYANFGNIIIMNSVIDANKSRAGAGISSTNANIKIANTTISNNKALGGHGGGISYMNFIGDNLYVENCVISNNVALFNGGGIYCESVPLNIYNTKIENNISHSFGGGVYAFYSDIKMNITSLVGNMATTGGGGFYINNSAPITDHCLFLNNKINIGDGGGVYVKDSPDAIIQNTVFWNNDDDLYGADLSMLFNCDISDGDFDGQNNNISETPNFISIENGNYHLNANSLLINAGMASGESKDIDDEAFSFGSASDIGMDEFVDNDGDNLADSWELTYYSNLTSLDNDGNNDSDTLSNDIEYSLFTNPTDNDTDTDGLSDNSEINTHNSNPVVTDTDGDGLNDSAELSNGTDINDPDSDKDGMPDGWEVDNSLNPLNSSDAGENADSDYLTNIEEYIFGTDPNSSLGVTVLNVSSFGNIQGAIDAASGKTVIIVSAGTFYQSFNLKSDIVLYASSAQTTKISIPVNQSPISADRAYNVIIKNIQVMNSPDLGIDLNESEITFNNCVFSGNVSTGYDGGAIRAKSSVVRILNSSFANNHSNKSGGGFYGVFTDFEVRNSSFVKNYPYGITLEYSNLNISGSTIDAQYTGPAFTKSLIFAKGSNLVIKDCLLKGSKTMMSGGAINAEKSLLDIRNSVLLNNSTKNYGAGFYLKKSTMNLFNCLFDTNISERSGGSIYLYNSGLNVRFCTFINNSGYSGSGIYNNSSDKVDIKNSIFWNDSDDISNISSAMISYSNIKNGDYDGVNGNISQDPVFRSPQNHDFHLCHNSPCIDSGIEVTEKIVDVDGELHPDTTLYDMGIDEFVDTDNDNIPDFWETDIGADLQTTADIDNDGITDLEEYQYMTNPMDNDTDNDGLMDNEEVFIHETDPTKDADKDFDGLTDTQEILGMYQSPDNDTFFTNPSNSDTDGDMADDKWEIDNSFNPTDNSDGFLDFDNDGINNNEECLIATDPRDNDSPAKVYVDCNASSEGTGTAGNPYKTIPYAISHVITDTNYDGIVDNPTVIIIAPGTYIQLISIEADGLSLLGSSPKDTFIVSSDPLYRAIRISNSDPVLLKNITVKDSPSGIHCINSSKTFISNCIIENNTYSPINGGGLFIDDSTLILFDTIVRNNKSKNKGAGIYAEGSDLTFYNSTISNNSVEDGEGGGIYCRDADLVKIIKTSVLGNSSTIGGGIYTRYMNTDILSSRIRNNTAENGAGFYTNRGSLDLTNTVFASNIASEKGGGIYVLYTESNVSNSVFVSNTSGDNNGSGIYKYNAVMDLRNTILWNDESDLGGFVSAEVTSCDIKDESFIGVNGNISVDPKIVSIEAGNYHIFYDSQCVNAGSPIISELYDIDDETRPYNNYVDIGIDEVIDLDNDGLPYYWESEYGQNLLPAGDNDGDNLTNIDEYRYQTNPLLSDTDNDGISDYDEINVHYTIPYNSDTDDDGLSDGDELSVYFSDPFKKDTDDDLMPDKWEVENSLNPSINDAHENHDNDFLTNYEEYIMMSQPDNDASPVIVYVDNDASSPYLGTQSNPHRYIQTAINQASSPAVIYLSDGTYGETLSITINKKLLIYSDPDNRAVVSGDNADFTITVSEIHDPIMLKNLVVSNGKGGIYCYNSQLRIFNCLITNNSDSGIMLDSNINSVEIVGSVITKNKSIVGGGIWCYFSNPLIKNCLISQNQTGEGGGLWVSGRSDSEDIAPHILYSNIIDNQADAGGGIYNALYFLNLNIKNSVLWGNGDDLYRVGIDSIRYSNTEDGDYTSYGDHMVSISPSFGAPQFGRYNLTYESEMIGAGQTVEGFQTDIDLEIRPIGASSDIGADEFTDNDGDRLADVWELKYAVNLSTLDNDGDNDNDGVTNIIEYKFSSNPFDNDSDSDLISDQEEIINVLTDPISADTDRDGLSDAAEIAAGTNPLSQDTDGDGMSDYWEQNNGLNPLLATDINLDGDNDSLTNYEEFMLGTDPFDAQSPQVTFVDNDASAGGNGTESTPYNSISQAISYSEPPYIFSIEGYFEDNLSFGNNFVLLGTDKETSIIEGASSSSPVLNIESVSLSIIKNITLTGGKQLIAINNSNSKVVNCVLDRNTGYSSNGGGIYANNSVLELIDSKVINNTASSKGAGAYLIRTEATIENTVFSDNNCNYDGGGLYCEDQENVMIRNSQINDNYAYHYGGGLYLKSVGKFMLQNSSFAKNSARISGGAVYCKNTVSEMSNSAFYKNTRQTGQGSTLFYTGSSNGFMKDSIIWSDDTAEEQQDLRGVNITTVSYCNIEDAIGPTNNNISVQPMFTHPDPNTGEQYNLRLRMGSPCINSGSSQPVTTKDIDDETRPHDNDSDIGLDEFIDNDGDGLPDWFELKYFGTITLGVPDQDPDTDGILNIDEYYRNEIPVNFMDYDLDGMSDYWESEYGLDPNSASDRDLDPDCDTLTNIVEFGLGTNPNSTDSDLDDMPDGWEYDHGLNPASYADRVLDWDNDGLTNIMEFFSNTDPSLPDTDNDGMYDGWEAQYSLNPLSASDRDLDPDCDTLTNIVEFALGTNPNSTDSDNDGMPDDWEQSHSLDPTNATDGVLDPDMDSLTNSGEYLNSTDPLDNDSDDDGMPDGWEVQYSLNPLSSADRNLDPDLDTLTNIVEYQIGTNPSSSDTDNDGMPDIWEHNNGLNPSFMLDAGYDNDGDGLSNLGEFTNNTDVNNPDTDNDGMHDGYEVQYALNPLSNADRNLDPDNDTLSNYTEFGIGTNPNLEDTDSDAMPDNWEHFNGLNPNGVDSAFDPDEDSLTNLEEFNNGTDPLNSDTDSDGMPDNWEVNNLLNPTTIDNDGDPDMDTLINIGEFNANTNPQDNDSDDDNLPDGWEVQYGLNPLSPADNDTDPDGDTLLSYQEYAIGTHPLRSDTDNDGMPDNWEHDNSLNPIISDNDGDPDNDSLINLSEYTASTDPHDNDSDNDTMPDGWEVQYGLNPLTDDAGANLDWDDYTNLEEYNMGTDPSDPDDPGTQADTDNDGMPNAWENTYGLNPNDASDASADNDNDSLTNLQEFTNLTSPIDNDSDNDSMPDGWEVQHSFAPLVNDADNDADNDSLNNLGEYTAGTDPHDNDSDNDTMPDGWEVQYSLNPLVDDAIGDPDGDALNNLGEHTATTDPQDNDSDNDLMPDGWEVQQSLNPLTDDAAGDPDNDALNNLAEYTATTDPQDNDSDNDAMPDGWEVQYSLNPLVDDAIGDPDGDALQNLAEYTATTNPSDNDSEDDGMPDGWEVQYGLNPLTDDALTDTDGDWLTNYDEYMIHMDYKDDQYYDFPMDPSKFDSDGDGMDDGWEWDYELYPWDATDATWDLDGDGYTSLQEYTNGTDPNVWNP